jgi:hypothetical protein
MRVPGVLPLAFFLFLVPALIPIIERFWPSNTVWWSAIVVAVLTAASSALWLIYRKQLARADMPPPGAPADVSGSTWDKSALPPRSWRGWLLG